MSPAEKAAEKSTVANIRPNTMRAVCARRRGMLRTPNLNVTRLRSAIRLIPATPDQKIASKITVS